MRPPPVNSESAVSDILLRKHHANYCEKLSRNKIRRIEYKRKKAEYSWLTSICLKILGTMFGNVKKMMNVRIDYPGGALLSPKAAKPEELERALVSKAGEFGSEHMAKPFPEGSANPTVGKEMRLLERLHLILEKHFSDGHGRFYTTPRGHLEIFSKITEY